MEEIVQTQRCACLDAIVPSAKLAPVSISAMPEGFKRELNNRVKSVKVPF
jgi:hypothetical protein